jgi:Spy/CpxP family protein refolding chaperone
MMRRWATAAILLGLTMSSATLAQVNLPVPGGGNMMGGMMGGSCADFVKSGLAITDVQKGVWDAYAAALKRTPSSLQTVKDSVMTAISGGKPALEQLDAQITATESRLKALRELRPTVVALYAALSADQKKKADQTLNSCIQ